VVAFMLETLKSCKGGHIPRASCVGICSVLLVLAPRFLAEKSACTIWLNLNEALFSWPSRRDHFASMRQCSHGRFMLSYIRYKTALSVVKGKQPSPSSTDMSS